MDFQRTCFAIRPFPPGFHLSMPAGHAPEDVSTPVCSRFPCMVLQSLKYVFAKNFISVSTAAAFPHAAGKRADGAAALPHCPDAFFTQLRRLFQLRTGELPRQFAPRVLPLHCASPSTGTTPNRTRRTTPPSSAVTYARRCRRSIRTGQPANAAKGPSSTCHVPSV